MTDEFERKQRMGELSRGSQPQSGSPGHATPTSRLPPTTGALARAIARELQAQVGADTASSEAPTPAKPAAALTGSPFLDQIQRAFGRPAVQLDASSAAEQDPAEIHRLAAAGTSAGGSALPHLERIQTAFGHHDVTGVRAHVGGAAAAAAGALGARGYAVGDDVAFAAGPDLRLAAHEAAHVVQQRGGVRLDSGVGRSGDEYERHADAVADLVVRGESAQALLDERAHRGATGGPAVQRDEQADRVWLATLRHDGHGHWTRADGQPLTGAELRRLRRILRGGVARTPRSSMTSSVSAPSRSESSHPTTPEAPPTRVDEEREQAVEETGSSHDATRGGTLDHATGGRRRSTETLDDGTQAEVDQIDETRRAITPDGVVTRTERGRRAGDLRGPTFAIDVRDQLEQRRAELDREEAAATTDDERRALQARRTRLDADIRALSDPAVSQESAADIARRHRVRVVAEGDVTTRTRVGDYNPLDGTVGHADETVREVHDLEGNSGREVTQESRQLDLTDGSYEHREATERSATTADGSQMTDRESTATRVQVSDGRAERTRTRRTERDDRAADGTRTRTASERSTSGGVIVTDDETGSRVGHSRREERQSGSTTTAAESAGSVEVTDRRLGGAGSHQREVRRGDLRATARASADGSFAIDVTPIDDGTGRYRLTFTIHVGVATSGSASRRPEGSGARGSATLRGSAQGDLITTHVLSEHDAREYLDAAERADHGEHVTNPAEFSRIARLRAAGEHADTLLQSGALVGDGATAAAMEDGDSVTLDTQLGVGGDASGGGSGRGMGIDLEGGGDARWRRTVQVERFTVEDHPRVRVTVTYRNETEWHAGGTVSARGVGAARVRHAEEDSATDAVQFVLDPQATDYNDRYRRIVRTTDRDELRALEREYADAVRRSRHAEADASETEHEVGPTSEGMIGGRSRSHGGEDISRVMDDEGRPVALEGTVEGGNEQDVRVRAHDTNIDLGGHAEDVRGELDEASGMQVDITGRDQQIDPAAAVSDAADDFSGASGRERVAQVMARSPTEHLTHALRQFEHTHGYHLDQHDLEVLSQRARDTSRWGACCIVADRAVLAAWRSLRGALASPRPDAEEARIDRDAALHLPRVRALASWMRAADGNGADCLEQVLRHWGETRTQESSAEEDVGRGFEWPVSLRHTSSRYTTLVEQADGMRDRFERALARPDGKGDARAHFLEVAQGFDRVLREVRACEDFRSEALRSELVREIEQHRGDVHLRYRDFQRRWRELHPDDHDAAASDEGGGRDGDAPDAGAIAATRASAHDSTAARSRSFARALIRTLRDNHTHETRLLQAAQAAIPEDLGPLVGHSGRAEAVRLCTQVHELQQTWIRQIEDLRQAYVQAGTPETEWEVSTGPGTRRTRALEPNIGWLILVYRRAMQYSGDAYVETRIDQWRAEGQY